MALPSAFAFVWNPEVVLIGVLVVASNEVSNFPYQHQILYHYSLAPVMVLAMGTVYAISRIRFPRVQAVSVTAVAICSLVACGFRPDRLPIFVVVNRLVSFAPVPSSACRRSWTRPNCM